MHVWQVKLFREGVKHTQQKNAEKSLKRVIQMHQPDFWTLCIPINLNMYAKRWFDSLRVKYPNIVLDIWQADEIVRRVHQDESLIDSYFLRSLPAISKDTLKPILDRLDDFESVPKLLDNARPYVKDAADFYNGAIPDWRDIVQNFDAPREQFGKLWQMVAKSANYPRGRIPFMLITGRSGDGKSTVLMRLATELVEQGCELVFYCKDDAQSLHAEQFSELPKDSAAFVLIDRITRFDADNLRSFFERLYRASISVVIIGAAVRSLWEGFNPALENVADVCVVDLEVMTDNDIEALLDKLSADPDHADEYLGALAGLPREQQVALFRQKARRQLLVALLEAKYNRAFKDYVHGELGALENRFGREVRRAGIYVSALHRLDLSMPRNLLQRLLPNAYLDDDVLRRTHGLLAELLAKQASIVTRHALIAEVIFDSELYGQRRYEEIITNAKDEQERLIGRMLHAMILHGENALADMLFQVASKQFPHNVVLFQMHAILARNRGDINRARELFQKGVEADPKHAPLWQAWAIMEKDDGKIDRARELFEKGVEADPKNGPLWQAWAIMEKDDGKIDRARELFEKGVEADPKHAPLWQAWAIMEKDDGKIDRAREQFEKGVEADPKDAYTWQAWAIMEKDDGKIDRARELFEKGVEADPKHAPLWQAWAIMEKDDGKIDRARELFEKGVEADPKHAPLWQAWAIMEKDDGKIDRAREQFEKGVEADPKHAQLWQAWALMEENASYTDRARVLFQKGVKADPKNAPLWQAWARLETKCDNIGDLDKEFSGRWLFKKATEVAPKDQLCWTEWADVEKKQKNWAQAEQLYLHAATAEQDIISRARTYFDLAMMFANLNEREKEENYLLLAIDSNPKDSIAHARMGRTYGFQDEWEKAEQHFQRSLQLKPNDYKTQKWYTQMQRARERYRRHGG